MKFHCSHQHLTKLISQLHPTTSRSFNLGIVRGLVRKNGFGSIMKMNSVNMSTKDAEDKGR